MNTDRGQFPGAPFHHRECRFLASSVHPVSPTERWCCGSRSRGTAVPGSVRKERRSRRRRGTTPFSLNTRASARNRAETPSGCPEGVVVATGEKLALGAAAAPGRGGRRERGTGRQWGRSRVLPRTGEEGSLVDAHVRVVRGGAAKSAGCSEPLIRLLRDLQHKFHRLDTPTMPLPPRLRRLQRPFSLNGVKVFPLGHRLPSPPSWQGRRHAPEFDSGHRFPCLNN